MSKHDHNNTTLRYSFIAIILAVIALGIVIRAFYIMTAKREYWTTVANQNKRDGVVLKQQRGKILSCDGQLMSSTLPQYQLFFDYLAGADLKKKDSLLADKMDSICEGLHEIFPEMSAEEFRKHMTEGRHSKKNRRWPIWKKRVNYTTYKKVKKLPVFRLSQNAGGFIAEANDGRSQPFGSLALRTIGTMYKGQDLPRYGLEMSYDSVLRGKEGYAHTQKVRNQMLKMVDIEAVDGDDIMTTIDVKIQDIAEKAVVEEMKEDGIDIGVAIVMEVKTGDIKAMVNMERCDDGTYKEMQNHAVSDLLEPGSVFKTASLMVAIDDGVVDTNKIYTLGSHGVHMMYGREMRDHNWRRGGYPPLKVPDILANSSNIGVSRIVDENYHKNPEKFVEGLHRIGIAEDLHVPLPGSAPPRIRMPKKAENGQWLNWSNTSLAWMSIGYETQVPPISTVTFYNAIANGGRMMKPRLVKQKMHDGEVVKVYEPVVLKEHICKESTLGAIQAMLRRVVTNGTGKKAGSKSFNVAGKTGTAQIAKGKLGYKSGTMNYLLSFVGFFPYEDPQYTCIVCLQKSGTPASGTMSAKTFKVIAEGIMAHNLKRSASDLRTAESEQVPNVKKGRRDAADTALRLLGFGVNTAKTNTNWCQFSKQGRSTYAEDLPQYQKGIMPDVTGMGARDAVYMIESRGLVTRLSGRGRVTRQSIASGTAVAPGDTCILHLE